MSSNLAEWAFFAMIVAGLGFDEKVVRKWPVDHPTAAYHFDFGDILPGESPG
jgi:hypothetical protein